MRNSLDELCATIAGVLGVPPEKVTLETSSQNNKGWDSLRHIQILLAVEGKFGIRFRTDEMPGLASIDALAKRLELTE